MAYVVWRVLRKKYLRIRSGITVNGLMTTDGHSRDTTDGNGNHAAKMTATTTTNGTTATTAVGHFCRQFSKKKKKIVSKKRLQQGVAAVVEVVPPPESVSPSPRVAVTPTVDPPSSPQVAATPTTDPTSSTAPVTADNLHIRSALAANVEPAPNWLVADHFAAEEIVCEHLSVALEPDHADPVPVTQPVDDLEDRWTIFPHETRQKLYTVQQLVDEFIGPYYVNYGETRAVLLRQAKQLLATVYQTNIVNFHHCYCMPASEILKKVVKTLKKNQCCDACAGWPLSHGQRGVLTHLIAPISFPSSDAYLLLDVARAGLTLNWVGSGARLRSRLSTDTVAMLAGDLQQLSATLKHLVAVVDRSVQRVPLDRITYPCYGCQDRTCQSPRQHLKQQQTFAENETAACSAAEERGNGGSSVYDDADNSIPHIDSDPEDSVTQDGHGGTTNNDDITAMIHHQKQQQHQQQQQQQQHHQSVKVPKFICDISEDVLTSGVQFPGTVDRQGNAVILWVEEQSGNSAETMSDVNAAELILYYASLRNRNERNSSLTILVHENSCTTIEFVDCVLVLIKHQVSVDKVIFCTKRHAEGNRLKHSQIRCYAVNSYDGLLEFFEDSQIPSSCGGPYAHGQLEWIDFYKESERLTCLCQTAGNRLVTAMADMGSSEQERNEISKFLDDSDIKNLLQDARQSMDVLEQQVRWLHENRFVMSSFEDVKKFHGEVEDAAVRLEELLLQKKMKMMQAARLHALETETHEVISWLTNKGEHALVQHADLANSLPAIRQQEQDFEKFYFVSMVSNEIVQ